MRFPTCNQFVPRIFYLANIFTSRTRRILESETVGILVYFIAQFLFLFGLGWKIYLCLQPKDSNEDI